MNKVLRNGIFFNIVCLLAIIAGFLSAGCQPAVTMPLTITEYSLTDLWDKAVEITGVQERTAQLGSFQFRVESNDQVRANYFTFTGRNQEGRPMFYQVSTNVRGVLSWYSCEIDVVPMIYHPRMIFEEIDKLGLTSVPRGDEGYSLQLACQSGTLRYSGEHLSLYHLSEGNLAPLKDVFFATASPWVTINVAPIYVVSESVDKYGRVSRQLASNLEGKSLAQTWFLSIDLNKAEVVEYL